MGVTISVDLKEENNNLYSWEDMKNEVGLYSLYSPPVKNDWRYLSFGEGLVLGLSVHGTLYNLSEKVCYERKFVRKDVEIEVNITEK